MPLKFPTHQPQIHRLRGLHLIGTLRPSAGGPPHAVRLLLGGGEDAAYSGEVVTMDAPGQPFLNCDFPIHALGPVRTEFGYTPHLRPWLRDNLDRFDFVVVHGLWNFAGYAVLREVAGKLPYFVFVHGMLDPYFRRRHPLKHLKKWLYWLLMEEWVLGRADHVVFTSEQEARLARGTFFPHKWSTLVVPYGAGTPMGKTPAVFASFAAACPDLLGRPYLLHLGRLHPKKGCEMLIRAFSKIAAERPDLDLVMAGPDQAGWERKLKRLAASLGIAERLHWPGMLGGSAKWGAFYGAEAFVLPSHQENFGIAVAAALACGTPVLLSDKVNIAEEILQDGAGLMEADTQAGTDKLLRTWLGLDLGQRAAMRRQTHKTFASRYSMRRAAELLLAYANEACLAAAERQPLQLGAPRLPPAAPPRLKIGR